MVVLAKTAFGQLQADAGSSTVICQNQYDVISDTIGGNPSASGGIGDYQYSWEAVLDTSFFSFDYYYTASYFLDDTTKANPVVVNSLPTLIAGNSLDFKLTVRDSLGNEATDSVDIVFSKLAGIALRTISYSIYPGDSVRIDANIGTIAMVLPIEKYIWQPGRGLKDSTSAMTWAMPIDDVEYSLTVIDTGGCEVSAGPFFIIKVKEPNTINTTNGHRLKVYPNPITKQSIIQLPENIVRENYHIVVLDEKGAIIQKEKLHSSVYPIRYIQKPGMYFFRILRNSEIIYSGSFVKN